MFLRSGKRKRVAEPKPRNVRPKVKMPKKKKAVAIEEPKITGLDDDCLEHVFGYLNATDLTNVAEAHSQFVPSARLAYTQKYEEKIVSIYNSGLGLTVQDEKIAATVTVFMEHFGCVLQSLSLDYSFTEDSNDHIWREIERNIFKHCSKTLTRIELKHCRANVMEEIRKPFENVATLNVTSGTVNQHSIRLSKWFPNIVDLTFDSVDIQNPDGINETFHFLNELHLDQLRTVDGTTEAVARRFLQSHRDIEHLNIYFEEATCSPEFLLFLSTTLTRLSSLSFINAQFSPVDTQTNIHFNRLHCFQLNTFGRMPSNVSISFDQLNTLNLYRMDAGDTMWRDFILRNTNLTQLYFLPAGNISADDLLHFVRNLPKLIDLAIPLSANELITFLESWQPSDEFDRFTVCGPISDELKAHHDAIKAKLNNKFQATIEYNDDNDNDDDHARSGHLIISRKMA